jgi:hypothetical protein
VTIYNEVNVLSIKPTGTVRSDFQVLDQAPVEGGMPRIEENSHLWLQLWFHKARRDLLTVVPGMVNPNSWEKNGSRLTITARQSITGDEFSHTDDEQLFTIEFKE